MQSRDLAVNQSPLKSLKAGTRGVVARFNEMDSRTRRKLRDMGITPGRGIRIEERSPRCVVRLGTDRLVLNNTLMRAISVRNA